MGRARFEGQIEKQKQKQKRYSPARNDSIARTRKNLEEKGRRKSRKLKKGETK